MDETSLLSELKGVGEKTAAVWRRVGVSTLKDLLLYFPRDYVFFPPLSLVSGLTPGELGSVLLTVKEDASVSFFQSRSVVRAAASDETGTVRLSWFHSPYMKKTIRAGLRRVFAGRVSIRGSVLCIDQPKLYSREDYESLVGLPQGVYPLTKGLTQKGIGKSVRAALSALGDLPDYLEKSVREALCFPSRTQAIREIHFPSSKEGLIRAKKRLAFDEFVSFLLSMRLMKEEGLRAGNDFPILQTAEMTRLEERLPFRLTGAQKRTIGEVLEDLGGKKPMNRLVEGDVGSGKTIVAFLALIAAAANGYQGALMAPTEVLAIQHAQKINALIRENELPFRAVLLTGSLSAKERREAKEALSSGEAAIAIGTHALIQENVRFSSLALVVTDEQHRFGVEQREKLGAKSADGKTPHVLVMSATPIPRTLAIILYGDLDISVMDEKPAKRLSVKNALVGSEYRRKACEFMEKEVLAGSQCYVICPQVSPSEATDLENVEEYGEKLRKYYGERLRVGVLHGQMKSEQKNAVMRSFAEGALDILVSTTVVEVGVDVPNATVMMIENAERFGLAELHQLRGRIGRGEKQSYCIFVNTSGEEKNKRLKVLCETNDGFEIASKDLELRGPGDLFGIRQSGELNLRMADLYRDADMLKAASDYVKDMPRARAQEILGGKETGPVL